MKKLIFKSGELSCNNCYICTQHLVDGVLEDSKGAGFKWNYYVNARDNHSRYEGIAEVWQTQVLYCCISTAEERLL